MARRTAGPTDGGRTLRSPRATRAGRDDRAARPAMPLRCPRAREARRRHVPFLLRQILAWEARRVLAVRLAGEHVDRQRRRDAVDTVRAQEVAHERRTPGPALLGASG